MSSAIILGVSVAAVAILLKYFKIAAKPRMILAVAAGLIFMGTFITGSMQNMISSIGGGWAATIGVLLMIAAGIISYKDLAEDGKGDYRAMFSGMALPSLIALFAGSALTLVQNGASTVGQNLQQMVSGLGG